MNIEQIIFTDLDGTLLNHHDYSFEEAREAIDYIKKSSIPLIIVTSKTFSEVRVLQEKLGIRHPFIVENGAGIFIPPDSVLTSPIPPQDKYIKISKSQSYLEVRIFFKHIKKQFPLKGFGDMSVEEVMELTGLSEESAKHSMRRNFTEPFILDASVNLKLLQDEAKKEDLEIVKGGRFYHIISQGQDKAKAMKRLTHLYEEYFDKKLKMIALGDSENDFSMLQAADVGILIPLPNGEFANIDTTNIIKAKYPGPKGWNEALMEMLDAK